MPDDPDEKTEAKIIEMETAKPKILKCSINTQRKLKKVKGSHRILDPKIREELAGMKIIASDQIPDHLIFLCDGKGNTLRMINLRSGPQRKPRSQFTLH